MVTASQRLQDTCKVLAGTDILLTPPLRGDAQSRASILQAFLRARAGTDVRPTGRRCSSGRHVRSICLFSMPWGRRSGLGNPGSTPGGATHSITHRTRPPERSSGGHLRCVTPQCPLVRLTAAAWVATLKGLHAGSCDMRALGSQVQTLARPVPSAFIIEIVGKEPPP